MLTLWFKSLLLLLHSLEPFFKSDLDHRRSDHSHFKIISATTRLIYKHIWIGKTWPKCEYI